MSSDANDRFETRRHASIFQDNRRVPSLRTHKASGQAYVVLNGKAIYCGRPDDPLTESHYHQAIAEWMAAGWQLPAEPDGIPIKELVARFWSYAEQYYRTLTDGAARNWSSSGWRSAR